MTETAPVPTPFLAGKKVIIAGAGLAGLTFAVALRQQWNSLYVPTSTAADQNLLTPPKIILYERNPKPSATDNDGYGLSIRSDPLSGGMQVLRKLNLLESALRASLTGSIAVPFTNSPDSPDTVSGDGGFNIWDKNWTTIMKFQPKISDPSIPVPAIRIGRKLLRQLLIDAIGSEDTIQWGVSCVDAANITAEDGTIQAKVSLRSSAKSDGNADFQTTSDTCDLLIAADGAHSILRNSLRPENKLSFTGAVCISGHATFPSESSSSEGQGLPDILRKDWGTMIGIAGGVSLFAAPVDKRSAIWSLSYLAKEERGRGHVPVREEGVEDVQGQERVVNNEDDTGEDWQKALKEEALHLGHPIAPPFQTLVRASPLHTIWLTNARDLTPFSHTSSSTTAAKNTNPTTERVVFIGDSNHAMSSFAGNGANMALMDGWDLAAEMCACVVRPQAQPRPSQSSTSASLALRTAHEEAAAAAAAAAALRSALKAYDALSMPRSGRAIRVSRWTITMAHAEGWRLWVYLWVLRVMRWVLLRRR